MAERRGRSRVLEAFGFRLLLALLRPLPRPVTRAIASILGYLAFDVLRIRRQVAVENVLARLDPPGGRAEAERIARESYQVMARTFLVLLRIDRISEKELWRELSREEVERFGTLLGDEGGVLVSGHFGNWELMVLAIHRLGFRVHAIVRDQANAVADRHVKEARLRAGVPTLSSRTGLRDAVRALQRGDLLATLMDQDARSKGLFVDFLGVPASSPKGVVTLAVRQRRRLIPGVLIDEGGAYRFAPGPPWRADPALSEAQNERAGVEHFHRFLEEQVRAHPGNYFWAHRRWKTRPPAGGSGEQPA